MNIDHMEFWAQLEARIIQRRAELQGYIDSGPAEPVLRHYIGERNGLQFVRKAAREVYAEVTGTTVQPPAREPAGDAIQL